VPSADRGSFGLSGHGAAALLFCLALFAVFYTLRCGADSPEVFPLTALTRVASGVTPTGVEYRTRKEYFVVANPPTDQDDVARLVEDYLAERHMRHDQTSYTAIIWSFYKETDYTPRDYVESDRGYFDKDRIEYHARDILVVVKLFPRSDKREIRFFSPDELP